MVRGVTVAWIKYFCSGNSMRARRIWSMEKAPRITPSLPPPFDGLITN